VLVVLAGASGALRVEARMLRLEAGRLRGRAAAARSAGEAGA